MTYFHLSGRRYGMMVLAGFLLLSGCSASRYMTPAELKRDQTVKLYLHSGEIREGIIIERRDDGVVLVSEADHQAYDHTLTEIRRVERSTKIYDYDANLISAAEIEKYKSNRNTWGYAIGGAAIGGLAGLVVGLPIWLVNDNPPPLFVAGLGLVVGSIYFATRGIRKDREIAVQQVRYIRGRENELEDQRAAEEKRLKEIEAEKERLRREIDKKKKKSGTSENR